MKAILEFNLPEDAEAFETARKGEIYRRKLNELVVKLMDLSNSTDEPPRRRELEYLVNHLDERMRQFNLG